MLSAAVSGRITEEEAVAIAERCGRLPLAMGLASARLRSRPLWRAEASWNASPTRTGGSTSSAWDTTASPRRCVPRTSNSTPPTGACSAGSASSPVTTWTSMPPQRCESG